MVIVLEPSTGRGGAGGMTVDDMTITSGKQDTSPLDHVMHHHHQTTRSRFMITDILSSGPRSPCSSPASSSEGPRDLSLHCRGEDSDGHESGTDSGLPGETSSVCSNGESLVCNTPRDLVPSQRNGARRLAKPRPSSVGPLTFSVPGQQHDGSRDRRLSIMALTCSV